MVESSNRELQLEIQRYDNSKDRNRSVITAPVGNQTMLFRDTLDDYIKKCPKLFNILEIEERYKALCVEGYKDGPYCLFVLQECLHINALLSLVSSHLDEISQALSGYLNMTVKMEEIMRLLGTACTASCFFLFLFFLLVYCSFIDCFLFIVIVYIIY